jgi:(1->4)-alpha-D-glucan 1-alpha-D-glucosylmutase
MARVKRNYRRFFDISELVGVRVEDEAAFDATHRRIADWVRDGKVTGLRVDHVDGLYDPLQYLERLQRLAGASPGTEPRLFVVVEKILSEGESVPEEWPVEGTTGYEFLNLLSGLFVDEAGLRSLEKLAETLTGRSTPFAEVVYAQKQRVLSDRFVADLDALAAELARLAETDRHGRDLDPRELREALREVTACLPVYRTYIRSRQVASRDARVLVQASGEAIRRRPDLRAAIRYLGRALRLEIPRREGTGGWVRLVMRWQQWTGAVMAKGLEDTALYRDVRLVSLNEVGGRPDAPAVTVDLFHAWNRTRRRRQPHALSATSTHDTKRSEDVRARLNVLSELPDEWTTRVRRWHRWNRTHRRTARTLAVPDAAEELLFYQTLVGAWPLDARERAGFAKRVKAYVVKAAREAKHHTSWRRRDPEHEAALERFVDAVLAPRRARRFRADLRTFAEKIAFYGALNSLGQVLLKVGAPGVADVYQGTELWDLSLVDPDNRRPVDFERRQRLLAEIRMRETTDRGGLVRDLLAGWRDGRVKLYTLYRTLAFRRAHAALFLDGAYLPVAAERTGQRRVCAFARRHGREWALVVVPLRVARLTRPGRFPLGRTAWGASRIALPGGAPAAWIDILTGVPVQTEASGHHRVLRLADVFANFPVAWLAPAARGRT